MLWYQLAENPHVITELYQTVPPLEAIDVMGIVFYEDAKMIVDANLPRFPDRPPSRWVEVGYNTIHILLEFDGIEAVQITQWSIENLVDLHIEAMAEGQIFVRATSPQCHFQAQARFFRIADVRAYLREIS
ncbi:MAG TPA: Imm50 family immunity protein [Ktedonobacteraceae bacterium]|nr:Imm50 family immunity protein [Ktedonobacteraceae bacterium]